MHTQRYSQVSHFLSAIHGFTKGDVITILLPTIVYSTAITGSYRLSQLLPRALWVWLHLLQFCVANQRMDTTEDMQNKPWRPVPSGLISLDDTRRLRWTLLPLCLFCSVQCDALAAGAVLSAAIAAYNDGHLDAHWLPRNILNALGYAAFNAGAIRAGCAGSRSGCHSPDVALAAQLPFIMVILTTVQAQDFKDVEGDAAIGRKTMPLIYPATSRILTGLVMPLWSLLFAHYYRSAHVLLTVGMALLGFVTGVRFYAVRTIAGDRTTTLFYNLWLCLLYIILLVPRGPTVQWLRWRL